MPPKKKKSAKKKKKKEDGEMTVDDKYKKTMEEIEALKDHLVVRKEIARRSQALGEGWKERMNTAEADLDEQIDNQKAVSADMTRQYKTMQTEMGLRIHQLETELSRTRSQLEKTEAQLKHTREEKEAMETEKKLEITELNARITTMGTKYESILNESMNDLQDKITNAKDKWEHQATLIHTRNKQTLLELGLNPLDL